MQKRNTNGMPLVFLVTHVEASLCLLPDFDALSFGPEQLTPRSPPIPSCNDGFFRSKSMFLTTIPIQVRFKFRISAVPM